MPAPQPHPLLAGRGPAGGFLLLCLVLEGLPVVKVGQEGWEAVLLDLWEELGRHLELGEDHELDESDLVADRTVLSLQHWGLTGSPSCLSRSPCWNHSSSTALAHILAVPSGLAGLEVSAMWSRKLRIRLLEFDHSSTLWPFLETIVLKVEIDAKCFVMSVSSTASTMRPRMVRIWSFGRVLKISNSGLFKVCPKKVERWKFSWMLWSLKVMALLDMVVL
eukprot:CAMPEP_0184309360 /NCGR_PEP_ID=MMETSP1049-20130417/17544_1 /TAXON_ID=77928 /ORGANISM="Proteomonas sulcata, Strain CCMP704" /LENGTH=219 /DNA_ID=CAMNT_0026622235 /DNA_START=761 /DNA_END=1421 /DNA_ORIENTATION=+